KPSALPLASLAPPASGTTTAPTCRKLTPRPAPDQPLPPSSPRPQPPAPPPQPAATNQPRNLRTAGPRGRLPRFAENPPYSRPLWPALVCHRIGLIECLDP